MLETQLNSDMLKDKYPKVIYLSNKNIGAMELEKKEIWQKLNPDYQIILYDNKMCKQFLEEFYDKTYVDLFDYLQDGPIKCDFWRICVLYKYGGFYSDMDIEPLLPLSEWIEDKVDFITCTSFAGSKFWPKRKFKYNPNFIFSVKNNFILKKCIDNYISKYIKKEKYEYRDYSIMKILTDNLKLDNYKKKSGIYYFKDIKIQIIKEYPGKNQYDDHNIYNDKRVFNNRSKNWDYKKHSFKPKKP